jgi:N-acetylneuraminate synthase
LTEVEPVGRIGNTIKKMSVKQKKLKTARHRRLRRTVKIGGKVIGDGQPVFFIAEIGINHNGDIKIAKKLISEAARVGCDAVKFQKRTVDIVYTPEDLARPRESPFGLTNGDLKRGLEFEEKEYKEVDKHCKKEKIMWFASPWDTESVDFLEKFKVPCYKVASACLTDDKLLKKIKATDKPVILSTGMSTEEQIDHAVRILGTRNLIILHCVSTYPAADNELNLRCIRTLRNRYDVPIGYSGHEVGLSPPLLAVGLGASVIERHITLDRAMWGSDQAASVEIAGLVRLVRDIKLASAMLGDGKKKILPSEEPILQKLRRMK